VRGILWLEEQLLSSEEGFGFMDLDSVEKFAEWWMLKISRPKVTSRTKLLSWSEGYLISGSAAL
jgi:hypothetical protein